MSAPEPGYEAIARIADPVEALEALGQLPDSEQREGAAVALVRNALLNGPADDFARQRLRAAAKRARVLSMGLFDMIAAEARNLGASLLTPDHGGADDAEAPEWPSGAVPIDGPAAIAYLLGDGKSAPGAPMAGAVLEMRGKGVRLLLRWCPRVCRVLETVNDGGEVTGRFYEIAAGGRSVAASEKQLRDAEPWKLLPVAGTGTRRMREILTDVVQDQAVALTPEPALTRTGWHQAEPGDWFYVFADGRAHDGRPVFLAGRQPRQRLAAAATPSAPMLVPELAAGMLAIAEHGHGPGLAGLAAGVRALMQTRQAVDGGLVVEGKPNAGKTSLGWHARTGSIARPDKRGAWPPLPSAPFTATTTRLELDLDYEADIANLIDDAPLHANSTKAERAHVNDVLEHVFRSMFNATEAKPRADKDLLPRDGHYVRGLPIATVQESTVQGSLKRRLLLLTIRRGDIDTLWYKRNGAGLVPVLRALHEHIAIPYFAMLGGDAPGYVADKDAEGLELLRPYLDKALPGWEDDEYGMSAPAGIAGALVGALLAIADMLRMPAEPLTAEAVPWLADQLAEQAAAMGDEYGAARPAEALADILRGALLGDRGAHVRNDQGVPWPAIEGLTEQEQGLEHIGDDNRGTPRYRPRGPVPIYCLPAEGGLGVPSGGLHSLVKRADDPRLPARTALSLPKYLLEHGAALPSGQRGSPVIRQVWIGGENKRLVMLPPGFFSGDDFRDVTSENPLDPLDPLDGSSEAVSNPLETEAEPAREPARESAPAARFDSADRVADSAQSAGATDPPAANPLPAPEYGKRDATSALMAAGRRVAWTPGGWLLDGEPVTLEALERAAAELPGYQAAERPLAEIAAAVPVPAPAEGAPACTVCGGALDAVLAGLGEVSHPSCDEGGPTARLGEREHQADAPASAPAGHAEVRPRPWLVLGADGRAYADGGEVLELPRPLAEIANAGELAAVALELATRRLYVPRPVRELLGLPAEIPPAESVRAGYPHQFTEATDPARWDIWPAEPVGLAGWMDVYRMPREQHEGASLVFPEWLPNTPALGELAPAELARALALIHEATTHGGEGRGGVAFHRSPAKTFERLLEQAARHSKHGTPEAVTLPPPYDRTVKRPRGAPVIRLPGPHMTLGALEVPAGWVLARLDVRSCFASAVAGTKFGLGEAVHRKAAPGAALEVDDTPGMHLVICRADAAAIHPALMPWFPEAGRRRDVLAWLDTLAVRWLADAGRAGHGVPFQVLESWTWPEHGRVFDSVTARLGEARQRLAADGGPAALAADAVVKAMANTFLGGWLASDFGGERQADDWTHNRAWWLTVRVQAEVRKQRNELPMIEAGAAVLGSQYIDSVYVAAPSLEALEAMPGTGGRPAIAEGRGKFKLEQLAEVTPELAAVLADPKGSGHARLAAIKAALGEGK